MNTVIPYKMKIIELIQEGVVSHEQIAYDLVSFLSESESEDFWRLYYSSPEDIDEE